MTQLEKDNPKGLREIFTNNADRMSMVVKEKVYGGVPSGTHFYCVAGGMSGLHLIEKVDPKKLTLVDINPVQIAFAKGFIALMIEEPGYLTFWKRYYCRDFGDDVRQLVYTDPDESWAAYPGFSEVPTVADRIKNAVPTDELPKKYLVHDGSKHDYQFTYGYIRCVKLPDSHYAYHSVTRNPAYPTCGVHHIYDGYGWHNPQGYHYLRAWLMDSEIDFVCGDIYSLDFEPNSYLYLTNLHGILREKNDGFIKHNEHRLEKDLFVAGDNYRETADGRVG